jgi:surfeit locus 1 family protein
MGWVADASSLEPDYFQLIDYQQRGIPIGRPAEVNLRNTHAQYIFTW